MTKRFTFSFLNQPWLRISMVTLCLLCTAKLTAQQDDVIAQYTDSVALAKNAREKALNYNKLARALIYVDLYKANEQANLGIVIAKQYWCMRQLGDLYNTTSIIHIYLGDNAAAHAYIDSAVAVYRYIGYTDGIASTIGNKGSLYNHNGEYDKAMKQQLLCLNLYTELGNKSAVATTLTNIFAIFHVQKDFEKARLTITHAYNLFDELGEVDGKAIATYNMAVLYETLEKMDSCLIYAKQSVALFQQLGNPDDIANGYAIYAMALVRSQHYLEGIAYADSAMALYTQIGHEFKNLTVMDYSADGYFHLGEYEQSGFYAQQLVDEGAKRGLKQLERDGAEWLTKISQANGDYKKALEYAQRSFKLEREILNERSLDEINRLRSEFTFARKELELDAARNKSQILELELTEKNAYLLGLLLMLVFGLIITWFVLKQRRLSAQQKTAQLEHKALRTQMNPHFIFNSLNSIQRMYVEGNMDEANEFTGDFAQLMRRILENSNKNQVTLHEEIDVLNLYLSLENLRCKNMFDYTFDIAEDIDIYRAMVPPLIIQPFVENAIWHGILPKQQRGHIRIEIRRENKFIRCVIADDGIGIQEKSASFHEPHGIRITEQRIGSKVTVESKSGSGTRIQFYIPYQTT